MGKYNPVGNIDFSKLRDGLSGIMRVRNESQLIENCIDSCINALDELIVVCNDCTDNTPDILARKQKEYPDKLKVYYYNHNVLSFDLTLDEYNEALALPDDSPRLYCNQCNYGISKVNYKYAVKIDTDQVYFEDELKKWRDVCAQKRCARRGFKNIFGWLFMMYFTFYRRLSTKLNRPCIFLLPNFVFKVFGESYISLAEQRLSKGKASISLSGFNVFKDDKWYITFDRYNIHPPYNGEGDTVIFKVSEKTYFTRICNTRKSYSVTEGFSSPYKIMFAKPMWFHLHANRSQCCENVKKIKDSHPDLFVPINEFPNMSYKQVLRKMDSKVNTLFQRTLFIFAHNMGIELLEKHLYLLDNQ